MTSPPWSELIAAHYRLQRALYSPRQEALAVDGLEGSLHWHPELKDPDWNHAFLPDDAHGGAAIERQAFIAWSNRAAERLGQLEREPVIVLAPSWLPRLATTLKSLGAATAFRHQWACWPETSPAPPLDPSLRFERVETPASLESLLRIFFEAFTPASKLSAESDPESLFNPGWRRSFERSVQAPTSQGVELRHYLARRHAGKSNEAVGAVSIGLSGPYAGFYNLAVQPSCQRQGLGALLQAFRIHEARRLGARWLFLQTEESRVADWNRRHGWLDGPELVGWQLPTRD